MAAFPEPLTPLLALEGSGPVLLVAPHATAAFEAAAPFVDSSPEVQAKLAEEVAQWHDEGSGEALEAAVHQLSAPGLRVVIPRGLMDLNRGWQARDEATESLFGKGALNTWVKGNLRDGASEVLEKWYRAAMLQIKEAADKCIGFVEIHSYGDLGSTYDQEAGGRPVRRSEASVVLSSPWATQYPVGLARLLPGDLRGTPKALERQLDAAMERNGFCWGPAPIQHRVLGPCACVFWQAGGLCGLAALDACQQRQRNTSRC
eukprot:TRINITY_DN72714_c0_g1_i1.p1 TRINITY_DN72714_c0_g1~~TRINITY_DN72714_c0_g1_i1.p1  ORF type:complete len:260 (+),score=47.41 TRINITY_DN72714_c0_g1_i1:56-835(+)